MRHYERNREQRGRSIQFSYYHEWDDTCGRHFGFRAEPGQTVKVWFGRRGSGFEVLRFEPVGNAVPEESSEDES